MRINRKERLKELSLFAKGGSGVVTGTPGAGKSHILVELVVQNFENGIPACLIKLDSLTSGDDAEIGKLLRSPDASWLERLQKIPVPEGEQGLIVFDAFDALRNDSLRDQMLKQISRAKSLLYNWHILVSVRNYDAVRSPKLIELFPAAFSSDGIYCRKYEVPILSDDELGTFLKDAKALSELYGLANERLKAIFRIPFFLKLLELIVTRTDAGAGQLSVIRSEIEVLDMYWNKVVYRVPSTLSTEKVLKKVTNEMITAKQLHVDKYDLLDELSDEDVLIVDRLLSEHVLVEQSAGTQLVYGHNILFDYAVSRLIIRLPANRITAFIQEDPARPFFLRPSFIYFFTRLWYNDRSLFWTIYQELAGTTDSDLQLFNKLVPAAVIIREMEQPEELDQLFTDTRKSELLLRDLLQGLRYLDTKAGIAVHARLLARLGGELQMAFVGDFAMILNALIEKAVQAGDQEVLANCGLAARALFDFGITNEGTIGFNVGILLAYHAIPAVSRTFCSDSFASRERLAKILYIVGQEAFDIKRVNQLIDGIKYYAASEEEFIEQIYRKIFRHQENDTSATQMLSSVMMNFTSNRRDEFDMCRFRLTEFFPTYLREFPKRAISLAVELLNEFVAGRNGDGIRLPEELPLGPMVVSGIQTSYQPDMSHFWFSSDLQHKEVEIVNDIFTYLDELVAAGSAAPVREVIVTYLQNAKTAKSWEMLLEWAAANPEVAPDIWIELLRQKTILFWSDTVVAAGALLEAIVPKLSDAQLAELEEIILAIKSGIPETNHLQAEEHTFRLLSRIPAAKLQRQEAKDLFAERPAVENSPVVEFNFTETLYTTRMYLTDQGVDVNAPEVAPLLTLEQELVAFEESAKIKTPDEAAFLEMLNQALNGFEQIAGCNDLAEQVVSPVLISIASVISLVLEHNVKIKDYKVPMGLDYVRIRRALDHCLAMNTESDKYAAANYSPGGIHTSTPKSEAAGALNFLHALTEDPAIVEQIKVVANDPNPIARYRAIRHMGLLYKQERAAFWDIIFARVQQETDSFILGQVIAHLNRTTIYNDESEQLLAVMSMAKERLTETSAQTSLMENFWYILLVFYRLTGNVAAKVIICEVLNKNLELADRMIFDLFKLIEPENFYRNFKSATDVANSKRLVDLLSELLDLCRSTLIAAKDEANPAPRVKSSFVIINGIIQRNYFSMQVNDQLNKINNNQRIMITQDQREDFYALTKPLLTKVLAISSETQFLQPSTAQYLIETLASILPVDTAYALSGIRQATELAAAAGYTQENMALREALRLTQVLLADHRQLLNGPAFHDIKGILQIYAQVGWPEAMQLLWQLDEIFR